MPEPMTHPAIARAEAFCEAYGLRVPVLMAPMAGACPPELAIAVARAGGMGACGSLVLSPDGIADWARQVRGATNGAFQLNTWIPDPAPVRDSAREAEIRAFLANWGPEVPEAAADGPTPDFDAQCEAMLAAGPAVISSIMGLYPPDHVGAQGMEAGGHRGAFEPGDAATALVGLFALLPAVVDAVSVPVVATGGIADPRGVAAALTLGASAVQVGTGLLRAPEAGTPTAWADAIGRADPEGTLTTRAFTGRLGRSIRTAYAEAAAAPDAPVPAPYPVQGALARPMRTHGITENKLDFIAAWAGQSAHLAQARPADEIVTGLWDGAVALLTGRG